MDAGGCELDEQESGRPAAEKHGGGMRSAVVVQDSAVQCGGLTLLGQDLISVFCIVCGFAVT